MISRPKTHYVDGDPHGLHELMALLRRHVPYYWTWRYQYNPATVILYDDRGRHTIRCHGPGVWEFDS